MLSSTVNVAFSTFFFAYFYLFVCLFIFFFFFFEAPSADATTERPRACARATSKPPAKRIPSNVLRIVARTAFSACARAPFVERMKFQPLTVVILCRCNVACKKVGELAVCRRDSRPRRLVGTSAGGYTRSPPPGSQKCATACRDRGQPENENRRSYVIRRTVAVSFPLYFSSEATIFRIRSASCRANVSNRAIKRAFPMTRDVYLLTRRPRSPVPEANYE